METANKPNVINTIDFYNTVGKELAEIVEIRNRDIDSLLSLLKMSLTDFENKDKFTNRDISKIIDFFEDKNLGEYLKRFQADYAETKKMLIQTHKENVAVFRKLEASVPMLRDDFCDGLDILTDITDFFGAESEAEIIETAANKAALFRAGKSDIEPINLMAWLRRGELDMQKQQLPAYDKDALAHWVNARHWAGHLSDADYFKSLHTVFEGFGVSLIFTPYIKRTVYGAVRWFDGRPLIQISDRFKNFAACWHTLFHEIGHVLIHHNSEFYDDDISFSRQTKIEKEADDFANRHLFGGDGLRRFVFSYKNKTVDSTWIGTTAKQFVTDEMFVRYWARLATVKPIVYDPFPKIEFE